MNKEYSTLCSTTTVLYLLIVSQYLYFIVETTNSQSSIVSDITTGNLTRLILLSKCMDRMLYKVWLLYITVSHSNNPSVLLGVVTPGLEVTVGSYSWSGVTVVYWM